MPKLQREKLTQERIDSLQPPPRDGSRYKCIWDGVIPGFGVKIYESGRKSYVLKYRIKRRQRQITLGNCDVLPLKEASALAQKYLAELTLYGIDPLAARRKESSESTVKHLCSIFLERHAKPHKKSWKKDESRLRRYVIPALGTRVISDVTTFDLVKLHAKISASAPYEANRTLEVVRTMYNKAILWDLHEGKNPAAGVKKNSEEQRDRFITHMEWPRVARAIEDDGNKMAGIAIWFLLLTGMRKSEALKLKWKDICFHRRVAKIGENKSNRVHYVPLTKEAVKLLQGLPRTESNPYIFQGERKGKPMNNIDKAWRRMRKRAGIEDVQIHDLRRTLGSWMAQQGCSLHEIGAVLNHKSPNTTKVYARFANEHLRKVMQVYTTELEERS